MVSRQIVRIALSAALALSTLCPAAQQSDQLATATRNQLAAIKVVLAQQAAWNKGDLDAYATYYKDAPDTTALLGGPVRGLSNIRIALHQGFPNKDSMGQLEQTEVEARELGDNFVLVTGKYTIERNKRNGGRAEGSFAEIVEKTPTAWLVVFSQST